MASKKELEGKLTTQQRKAAHLLIENDLELPEQERLTQDEIAAECKTTRNTLYRWRTQDESFIEYMNLLSDGYFKARRSFVYRQLMKTIAGSQPSVKGIDIYFRRFGLLTEKKEIELNSGNSRTSADLEKSIAELEEMLDDDILELDEDFNLDE